MKENEFFETAVKGTKIVVEKLLGDIKYIAKISAEKYDIDYDILMSIIGSTITYLLIENKIAIINKPKNEE